MVIDWKKISMDIISNLSDQGKITQILADLETDITTFNTRFSELETQSSTQAGQIESLQKTNMNLFLRLGNPTPDNLINHTGGTPQPENKLTYENLLNEWDKQGGK